MDIIFGECIALGGLRYTLLPVDIYTWYYLIYDIKTAYHKDIADDLEQ